MFTSTLSRAAAVVAVLSAVIVVGCVGTSSRKFAGVPLEQKNQITLAAGEERDVVFPAVYLAPPNVEMATHDSLNSNLVVVDCKPDHFRVRNDSLWKVEATWTATGDPAKPAAAPTPGK